MSSVVSSLSVFIRPALIGHLPHSLLCGTTRQRQPVLCGEGQITLRRGSAVSRVWRAGGRRPTCGGGGSRAAAAAARPSPAPARACGAPAVGIRAARPASAQWWDELLRMVLPAGVVRPPQRGKFGGVALHCHLRATVGGTNSGAVVKSARRIDVGGRVGPATPAV